MRESLQKIDGIENRKDDIEFLANLRQLEFHRISIGVVGFNKRALKFWESLAFKKEGVERDGYYYDNEYSDGIMMRVLVGWLKFLAQTQTQKTFILSKNNG